MKLVTAMLARNEADRYLSRVLQRCREFSDAVLLLDDRSVDATAKVAKEAGATVRGRSILYEPAWGHEAQARRELWDWACEEAGDGWVLFCDGDMLLRGDPRPLCHSWDVNAWAFILYDLWDSETTYRSDGFWQGHRSPRPWLIRPGASWRDYGASWQRGIHTGHIAPSFPLQVTVAPPNEYYWLHLAYCKKPHRQVKWQQYHAVESQLTEFERQHAASILDT